MGAPSADLRIAWERGGLRTELLPDGRLVRKRGRLGGHRPAGRLGPDEAADLSALLLAGIAYHLQDPSKNCEGLIEIRHARKTWVLGFTLAQLEDDPMLERTWELLEAIQRRGVERQGQPGHSAIDVEPSLLFWISMLVGGLLSFGLLSVVMLAGLRSMPQEMDRQGITLRNGKRYRWDGVKARIRNSVNPPNELLGCDLITRDGRTIRLTLGGFKDGERVLQYALDRIEEAGS